MLRERRGRRSRNNNDNGIARQSAERGERRHALEPQAERVEQNGTSVCARHLAYGADL